MILQVVPGIKEEDKESSIVDNSDGLNVLSDPRAPPPKGARKTATAPKPKTTCEPILYPLSAASSLQPCASCAPMQEPYTLSATDIPHNGLSLVYTQ